ncbi:DUF1788 domain-containing protein [Selenomonas noxia]|jgi:hypothetical protein|uniref:DUF1788 domain-containing protein n=1 Tax=Selenomonas noxia TaxID=135083 RepID=UPI0023597586|nr:DUF1788 domain-containing protein [Selenomonas noxia]
MKNLQERLDDLRSLIRQPDFLAGRGLSNEVNIRFFCYDPQDEVAVAHFLRQLSKDTTEAFCPVVHDLYHLFLDACDALGITGAIPAMEEERGRDFLRAQLHAAIGEQELIARIAPEQLMRGRDVLILTGVGEVFPFLRVHTLLAALQPHITDIPILVMYPGTFDGYRLRLFDRLAPNDYYRAFNIV